MALAWLRRFGAWIVKSEGEGDAPRPCQLCNLCPPPPRNTGTLPLIYPIGVGTERVGNCGRSVEAFNQICMAHSAEIIRGFLGLSSELKTAIFSGDILPAIRDNLGMPSPEKDTENSAWLKDCGFRLRLLRKGMGLTQEQLAEELDWGADSIGRYERGADLVSAAMLRLLWERKHIQAYEWVYTGFRDLLSRRLYDEMMKHDKKAGQLQRPDID